MSFKSITLARLCSTLERYPHVKSVLLDERLDRDDVADDAVSVIEEVDDDGDRDGLRSDPVPEDRPGRPNRPDRSAGVGGSDPPGSCGDGALAEQVPCHTSHLQLCKQLLSVVSFQYVIYFRDTFSRKFGA